MSSRWTTFLALASLLSCQSSGAMRQNPGQGTAPQAISLLGEPLRAEPSEQASSVQRPLLEEAQATLERDSSRVEAWIWVGRRLGYLQEYQGAIQTYTNAMLRFPDEARLYRHRGHRFLSVRETDSAIADFTRAAQLIEGQSDTVEPDGLPNARGIPTSTLHFNIWYHLGLA
ncbi:MAG: tetratricopeptide repeat protein, partial [Longimicrobiales bacterium]